jgi:hypothetical protein
LLRLEEQAMDLELRRFQRDFRRHGGHVTGVFDGPSMPSPKTEIGWFVTKDGRTCAWGFAMANTLEEAQSALAALKGRPFPPEPREPPRSIFPYAPH